MVLKDNFKKEGDFLFRYRSYLPLVVIPFFCVVFGEFSTKFALAKNRGAKFLFS